MQNKPNLPDAQLNVNTVITVDYENKPIGNLVKTNPIQSQSKPIQTQFPKGQK
jgi:hypothetical protein